MNDSIHEMVYEDATSISIWRYDKTKSITGPFEVEIKYKRNYVHPTPNVKKTIRDLINEKNAQKKNS